ncbi:hypothetical protein C2E23DRAFT_803923, partial [Lenzites betulinus]
MSRAGTTPCTSATPSPTAAMSSSASSAGATSPPSGSQTIQSERFLSVHSPPHPSATPSSSPLRIQITPVPPHTAPNCTSRPSSVLVGAFRAFAPRFAVALAAASRVGAIGLLPPLAQAFRLPIASQKLPDLPPLHSRPLLRVSPSSGVAHHPHRHHSAQEARDRSHPPQACRVLSGLRGSVANGEHAMRSGIRRSPFHTLPAPLTG